MLSSITKQRLPIQECLRKCWLSRIHADVTVVLVENDHVWIRNIVQFVHMLPKPRLQVDCPNAKVVFLEETFLIEVGQHQSFRELGTMLFRLPLHLMMQIRVEHFTKQPRPTDFVCEFLAVEKDFDLYLGGYFLCTIRACERPLRPASVDEPANLYGIPTVHQGSALPFGPFDPEDLMFAQAIENLENLNCITSYPGSTFVIWAEKNLWAFTPFDGTEEHFATRIRTAFDRLVPFEKAVVIPLHKHFRWRTDTQGFIIRSLEQTGFEGTTTVLFESPRPDGTSDFRVVPGSSAKDWCHLHNGLPIQHPCNPQDGDVLVTLSEPVRAGGVHDVCKKRHVLLPGATFADRCEFACNTKGWAASDEIWHITSIFNWSTPRIQFLTPVFWDSRINELVTCDGQQVGFPNNSISILPILIDNHWAGIEVIRLAEVVQVLFVQVPAELQVRLHQILSRIFDVSPAMITVTEVWPEQTYNLCGRVLLKRWSAMLPFEDWQEPVDMTPVPPTKLQAIQIAVESSQEEWHASGADQSLFRFATQCRTRFLAYLARSTTAVSSAVTMPLSTNVHSIEINPEARAATLSPFSGETPRRLIDYINRRLEDFRSEPTWAASDEIDFALDVVRLYVSHTLIITPLVWDAHTTSFRSITGVQTPLAGPWQGLPTLLSHCGLADTGSSAMYLLKDKPFLSFSPTPFPMMQTRRSSQLLLAGCLEHMRAMSPLLPVTSVRQRGCAVGP